MTPSSVRTDSILAAALISSPAWAGWLAGVNELLTFVTLFCGALLGIGRLWLFIKRLRNEPRDRTR